MLKCTELSWLLFLGFFGFYLFWVYLVNCLVGFFCCLFFLAVVVLGFFLFLLVRLIQTQISPQMRYRLAPLVEGIHKNWLHLGFKSHLLCWRSRYHSGDLLLKEMILLLPVWWINEKHLWSCFWHLQHIIGLLHMLENLRPLPLNSSTY